MEPASHGRYHGFCRKGCEEERRSSSSYGGEIEGEIEEGGVSSLRRELSAVIRLEDIAVLCAVDRVNTRLARWHATSQEE